MDRIRITDVSPRDGLQNEPGVVPTADKVRLIELLAAAGVDEVEATSFVPAKWAPQLGDAEEVLGAVKAGGARRAPEPSPSGGGSLAAGEWGEGLGRTIPRPARDPKSTPRARELRRSMTGPERAIWSRIRGDQLGALRFRRQHVFGSYIVDFYCPAAALVIEIDGRTHEGSAARSHDAARTRYLESLGLRIIRFTDDDAIRDTDAVVRAIRRTIESPRAGLPGALSSPTPLSPPLRGDPPPEGEGSSRRPRPVFSALVPNEKGFERALAFHSADFPLKIALFTAASETFNKRNTNATIGESVERFRAFLPRAFGAGMQVRFYISCAVACPFEGKVEPAAVRRVAERLIGLVPEDRRTFEDIEIDLGDTIGVAAPGDIRALLGEFRDDAWRDLLVLHLHDTFGRAVECARAAIDLGVWSFDASVAGLGGCPYAGTPERRAPGNVSTEALARLADDLGLITFIDPDALADAAGFAREIVARARAGAASREGVR